MAIELLRKLLRNYVAPDVRNDLDWEVEGNKPLTNLVSKFLSEVELDLKTPGTVAPFLRL